MSKTISFENPLGHTYEMEVGVGMINYGGHLGNDSVLTICHDARISWLKSMDLSELNVGEDVGLIQTEAFIKYKSEGHLHDQLEVELYFNSITSVSFCLEYKIINSKSEKVVAEAYTTLVGFDYPARRIAKLPEGFKKIFS